MYKSVGRQSDFRWTRAILLLLLHYGLLSHIYCGAKQFINVVYIYECNTYTLEENIIYIYIYTISAASLPPHQPIVLRYCVRRTNTRHIFVYFYYSFGCDGLKKENFCCFCIYTYIYICSSARISLCSVVRALLDKSPIANGGDSTQISR